MPRQTFKVTSLADRHSFIKLPGRRLGFITKSLTRPGKNGRRARLVSAYFGFSTQSEAQNFVTGLRRYFPKAFCQIRKAERLTTAIEVKVREFPALEQFIWQFAANTTIVTPAAPNITPAVAAQPIAAEARTALQQSDYPTQSQTSNLVSFDRSNAPLAHRSRPKVIGGVSID